MEVLLTYGLKKSAMDLCDMYSIIALKHLIPCKLEISSAGTSTENNFLLFFLREKASKSSAPKPLRTQIFLLNIHCC